MPCEKQERGSAIASDKMSSEDGNASGLNSLPNQQINKAPGGGGKGGKSLQLMQQRLMAQQQQQQQQAGASAPDSQPEASPAQAPAASPATGALSGTPQASPLGRPKGKDFSAMSARVAVAAPADVQPPAATASPSFPVEGKPKGKDFSAMASRMGPPANVPPSQPQQQPQLSQADKDRAASLQAGARRAAGLPPLDRPTATSVTRVPPTIPPPNVSTTSMSHYPTVPGGGPPHTGAAPMVRQGSGSYYDHSRGAGAAPMRQSPVTAPPAKSAATAPPPPPIPRSTQRTKPPSAMESRLSAGAAPHMAPLVGPRIQDLLQQIDPSFVMDSQAEQQVLLLVDDFMDKVCKQSLRLAQHRSSKTIDVQDVQMVLAKQWNIVIPGLGPPGKPKNLTRSLALSSSSLSSSAKRRASSGSGTLSNKVAKTSASAAAASGPSSSSSMAAAAASNSSATAGTSAATTSRA